MRLKYRVLGQLPANLQSLPSVTMVLGRFGDLVVYADAPAYLSWYPTCMRGWSQSVAPPSEWDAACGGYPDAVLQDQVAHETLFALDAIIPGIRSTRVNLVDAGIIYARGDTDIDDRSSELHSRHDIGFRCFDGYYSVDTGKFTCAPMFAKRLADHLYAMAC
jgi:hypothetical protein